MMKRVGLFSFLVFMMLFASASFAPASSKDPKGVDSTVGKQPSSITIGEAMRSFNSFSNREKRIKIREIKKAIKDYKQKKKEGSNVSTNTLLLIIIAILIPPLAVYIHEGDINNRFWISVLLTVLGYILFGFAGIFFLGSLPGIIYALYVILSGT